MPLSSYCRNCGDPKSLPEYGQNYCKVCTDAVNVAKSGALDAGTNQFDAARSALAQRAHDVRRNRPDPRFPMTKADYWQPVPPSSNQPPAR